MKTYKVNDNRLPKGYNDIDLNQNKLYKCLKKEIKRKRKKQFNR